jgi:hypothetical protein
MLVYRVDAAELAAALAPGSRGAGKG